MNSCARPIDPLDAEALASGEEPVVSADAGAHAAACPDCARAVAEASRLAGELDQMAEIASRAAFPVEDLADRVIRIRPFSRRERRSMALWRAPILTAAALFFSGFVCLLAPGVSAREQAGLGIAALAPLAAFFRAFGRSLAELAAASPAGLEALSSALRQHPVYGLAALLLLLPAFAGLKRAAARAARS